MLRSILRWNRRLFLAFLHFNHGATCYVVPFSLFTREVAPCQLSGMERMAAKFDLKGTFKDTLYAVRSWRRGGGSALIAALALAMAISVTTALFSVVKAVLLSPLPFKDPDKIAVVWETRPQSKELSPVLPFNFRSWKQSSRAFTELAAIRRRRVILTQSGEPVELNAESVSPNLFRLLGLQVPRGRAFLPGDDSPGKEHVALLSEKIWHDRFGSDPGILGRAITLDDQQYEVIGVAPAFDVWLGREPDIWTPLVLDDTPIRFLTVVGRLDRSASLGTSQAEFHTLTSTLQESRPDLDKDWGVSVVSLVDQLLGNVRLPIVVLFASVLFVLLIACANVANICLVRVVVKRKAIAVRCALGASNWRLMRQTLLEALVLTFGASLIGICLAYFLLKVFIRSAPTDIPRIGETTLDLYVVCFALVLTFLTAIAVGIVPARRAAKVDLNESLKGKDNSSSSSTTLRASDFFVMAQVALAVCLLSGATLLLDGLWRMQTQNLGFDPHSVLTMSVKVPATEYKNEAWLTNFYPRIIQELETLPGVVSAAATSALPTVEPLISETQVGIVGQITPPGRKLTGATQIIDGDYFRTMGIALLEGRTFSTSELMQDRSVVIVNDTFVKEFLGTKNALGQRIIEGGADSGPSLEIIGVAADVAPAEFGAVRLPLMYVPLSHFPFPAMTVVLRTSSTDPLTLTRSCVDRIHLLEPGQPVAKIMSMEQGLAARISRPRFNAMLLSVFSVVALFLALAGVYSVVAYNVSQSTREVGIRLAIGASRPQVMGNMLRRNLLPVIYGLFGGVLLAIVTTKLIASIITVGSVAYPVVLLVGVFSLFFVMASVATCIPLLQTFDVDPILALRTE